MGVHTRLLSRRLGLAVVAAGLTCMFLATASSATAMSGTTIKVQPTGTAAGTVRTFAKVCQIDVVPSGLTPGQVYSLDFAVQGRDAPAGTAVGPIAVTADAAGGFTSGAISLTDGHYKVLLYTSSDMTTPIGGSKVIMVACPSSGASGAGQGGTPPPVVHGPDMHAGLGHGKGLGRGSGRAGGAPAVGDDD